MTSVPPPAPPSLDPPYYQPPPPPPPGPPVRGQLRRSRTDKVIGGVAGGLAQYSGIDALLWRVGFVALTFAGGTGILVYLLLWLLMPAAPAATGAAVAEEQPAEPAGPRSPVPGVTVAALLILMGLFALIAQFTEWDPGPRGFLGAALLVVGLGLIASAFSGGRTAKGGLITLGIVLSVALLFASAVPWRGVDHGVGDQTYREFDAADVQRTYHGGVGDFTLDLSDVDVSDLDRQITTRVNAGIGDVDVVLPRTADVEVSVDSGLGNVRLFGSDRSGGFFPGRGAGSWIDDGDPEIVLMVHAGIGDVEVSRG